jgi:hypothetical protein
MYLDNHLKLGDLNNPTVNGSIKVNKDTNLLSLCRTDPIADEKETSLLTDNPLIIET